MLNESMLQHERQLDRGWDYRDANTKEFTHGIHPYPAMMIPQVARRLIQEYASSNGTLFDPYCGTGTTLLEGMLAGQDTVGTDLNPLARLIAKVKTTPIDIESLDKEIENFIDFGLDASFAQYPSVEVPHIPNINYWFDTRTQSDLALILSYVDQIAHPSISDFFRVALSLTVRKTSWTKNSEFNLVRIPPTRIKTHDVDAFPTMVGILGENRNAVAQLVDLIGDASSRCAIHAFNTVSGIPTGIIDQNAIDMVVTSPPYGDSRTTVAYGQFSRLSSQWLGFQGANRVDNILMGGSKLTGNAKFGFSELDDVIAAITETDPKRGSEVASFFVDYRRSVKNVASVVKPGAYICYVVGNRTVRGRRIPTAETTAAFFEMSGFNHQETFRRNIPNKRMPHRNSPTNVPGKLGNTMNNEFIIVCRKAE